MPMAAHVAEDTTTSDPYVAQLLGIITKSLSPETDPITPEMHKQLDAAVYMAMKLPETGNLIERYGTGRTVLIYIVETCPLDYRKAGFSGLHVMGYYSKLGDVLYEVLYEMYKARHSFATIRRSKYFRLADDKTIADEEAARVAIQTAWTVGYRGNTHRLLISTLSQMNRQAPDVGAYSNILPIVQSSGAGKSRCVHEAAGLIFTLPLNVRPSAEDSEEFAYPPTDLGSNKHEFFTRHSQSWSTSRTACCAFFAALFSTAVKFLGKLDGRFKIFAALALAWRELLEADDRRVRKEMYAAVFLEAERLLKEGVIVDKPAATLDNSGSQIPICDMVASDEGTKLRDAIISRVAERLPADNWDPTIIFYLDEAHGLSSISVDAQRNVYDTFVSAASRLTTFGFVAVTLSTNSNLAKLAPPMSLHASSRPPSSPNHKPPFTELGFDCYTSGSNNRQYIFRPNKMSLKEVSEVSYMVKFGRPLFWSRWDGIMSAVDMVKFAREKLTGRRVSSELDDFPRLSERPKEGMIAALSTRILLEFEPTRESARTFEMSLVERHMRIAYSVPTHREYYRSGNPSEPILAEAAAQEMSSSSRPIAELLRDYINEGLIDEGTRGELVGRLLLTLAYDKAIRDTTSDLPKKYSRGVTVEAFLKALFSEKYTANVLSCRPDMGGCNTSLKDAFKDAYVRFTHFVQYGNKNHIDTHSALAGIARGMAVQVKHTEATIDLMVPITMEQENLREEIMSGILIQIKARSTTRVVNIDADKLGFFPAGCKKVRPYIAILMQLGLQTEAHKRQYALATSAALTGSHKASHSPSKVITKQTTRHTRLVDTGLHPRYAINVWGCSPAVYGVVHNKDIYAELLISRNVMDEHPRRDEPNLAAVRRMKPVWERNEDCYDWIDDEVLQGREGIGLMRDFEDEVFMNGDGSVPMDVD